MIPSTLAITFPVRLVDGSMDSLSPVPNMVFRKSKFVRLAIVLEILVGDREHHI